MNNRLKIFLTAIAIVVATVSFGQKVMITVTPADADIFMNGERLGQGSAEIKVQKHDCVYLRASKIGYLSQEVKFCNKKGYAKPPKTHYFNLKDDDSFAASVESTDIANTDILIRVEQEKEELELWREINQIIMSYFDVIEVADRESGYLRTSWQSKSFDQRTVRTRIILKLASTNPTSYKLKILSENATKSGVSIKADEEFNEWDRVLKQYAEIVNEIQVRMK